MKYENWQHICCQLVDSLTAEETLALTLTAEDSLFVRFNKAKIRQCTDVVQGSCELVYTWHKRMVKMVFPFTFNTEIDGARACEMLKRARVSAQNVPDDPYLQLPQNAESYYQVTEEETNRQHLIHQCLDPVQHLDFVGLLAVGQMIRANYNAAGLNQWFECANFALDFSLYAPNQQAVKGLYGGKIWDNDFYSALIRQKEEQLHHLNQPLKTLGKGKYRAYFTPTAVANFLGMLSWNGIGQQAYRQGTCALKKLVDGEATLSPLFNLRENFSAGDMPRFNEWGEVCAEELTLIENGKSINLLCSTRTAKEYNCASNFANQSESLRCPEIATGTLETAKILETLGTGIYISDLHYLNWSLIQDGRLTGLTRFGCFWVENGKIVAPIQDMRFDDSLYHFWGQGLVGFTDTSEVFPELNTYGERHLGSQRTPGMIVDDFTLVN